MTLLSVIAFTLVTPAMAGKDTSAFHIKTTMEARPNSVQRQTYAGTGTLSGAFSDRGTASGWQPDGLLTGDEDILIQGKRGWLTIRVTGIVVLDTSGGGSRTVYTLAGSYEIVSGTGTYEGLRASGSASGKTTVTVKNSNDWLPNVVYRQVWEFDGVTGG